MENIVFLKDRSILEITGPDRKKFLQGLVTNDVTKAAENNLIYCAMLNAQGRFLYDFFIFEIGEKLILDCFAARRDEIFQKLNFYKLRSQVVIKKSDDLVVAHSLSADRNSSPCFQDPRSSKLGYRVYTNEKSEKSSDQAAYNFLRISNKIPESENDLTYEKSLILEFGFDDLNAIDYEKGCYVGQELTARTHHLGQIRKKIFHIKINDIAQKSDSPNFLKGLEISCEGKSAGIILSSVFHNSELHALSLIRLPSEIPEDHDFKANLEFEGKKIFIID